MKEQIAPRHVCSSCYFNPLLCGVDWVSEPCKGWARPKKITNVTDLRVAICQALGVDTETPAENLPPLIYELRQDLRAAHDAMVDAGQALHSAVGDSRFALILVGAKE